jgi:hypothetical protein
MTYAADRDVDWRWTVPLEVSGTEFEELWLACAADDIDEATAALKRLSHRRPEVTFDHLHRMFFSICHCYDLALSKTTVMNLVRLGAVDGVETADHAQIALTYYVRAHYMSLQTLESIASTRRIACRSKTMALIELTHNVGAHLSDFAARFTALVDGASSTLNRAWPMDELILRRLVENNEAVTVHAAMARLPTPKWAGAAFQTNYYIQRVLAWFEEEEQQEQEQE